MYYLSLLYIGTCITVSQYVLSAPSVLKKVRLQVEDHAQVISKSDRLSHSRISSRYPELEDERLNWGVMVDELPEENEDAFNRPITIRKNVPKAISAQKDSKETVTVHEERVPQNMVTTNRKNKIVKHETNTTVAKSVFLSDLNSNTDDEVLQNTRKALEKPTRDKSVIQCDAAIVSCCSTKYQMRRQCDIAEGCVLNSNVCELTIVQKSINNMIYFYNDSP